MPKMKPLRLLVLSSLILLVLCGDSVAAMEDHGYPRLANYFLDHITTRPVEKLARWDLLILTCSRNQEIYLAKLDSLRLYNPEIVLLAYIQSCGALTAAENHHPDRTYTKVYDKVDQEDWWLYDVNGDPLGAGDNGQGGSVLTMINVCSDAPVDGNGQRFIDWFPGFVADEILATGKWDGIFLDILWENISWRNDVYPDNLIDSNRDGIADDDEWLDQKWGEGLGILTSGLRSIVGDEYLISSNGKNTYHDALNGCMRENFPTMHGDWEYNIADSTHGYMAIETAYRGPTSNVINSFWIHALSTQDEPYMNYSFWDDLTYELASTLVFGDGYFSLDAGGVGHKCLWWLDVYEVELGDPLSDHEPVDASPGTGPWDPWGHLFCQRRFENGVAVVNATETLQEIYLDGIHYDALSFNGNFFSHDGYLDEIELSPHSGAIYMTADMFPGSIDTVACAISPGKPTLLEWEPVPGADRYAIYRANYDDFYPDESKFVTTTRMPRFADHGAGTDTTLYYRVSALSPDGFEGPPTEPVEAAWSEEDPGVSGHSDGEKILLRWYAVPYREYVITRDGNAGRERTWQLTFSPLTSKERVCSFQDTICTPGRWNRYEVYEVSRNGQDRELVGSAEFPAERTPRNSMIEGTAVWPNPSSNGFNFSIPWSGTVRAEIYDSQGRLVRSIEDWNSSGGTAHWSGISDYGGELPSGIYFYRLLKGEEESRGKLTIIR
jgi:hypothetical protein